jgi:hypothetical protein
MADQTNEEQVANDAATQDSPNQEQAQETQKPETPTQPAPIGVTPSPVELNDRLGKVLSDVEAVSARVQKELAPHRDVEELKKALEAAKNWITKELGV